MEAEPTVPLRDQIACVAREVRMREGAYPKWVTSGRMKQHEADRELARMRAVLAMLQELEAGTAEEPNDPNDARLQGEMPWPSD